MRPKAGLGLGLALATILGNSTTLADGFLYEFSGQVAVEKRWYPDSAAYPGQRSGTTGFVIEPELYIEAPSGWSFNLVPFLRHDGADSRRNHADLREAYFLTYGEIGDSEWELRAGVDHVFWGVTESNHLVDVINQTDLVEHPDEQRKLGQLMIHNTWSGSWGVAELFLLPHHRERTFPGRKGRLRSALIVDHAHASYESSSGDRHIDYALRYSRSLGSVELGFSLFDGTSREPVYRPLLLTTGPVLAPHYEQIRQFGLDAQLIVDAWLFKLEAIHRDGAQNIRLQEEDFSALVAGAEYTFFSIFRSAIDLSLLGEWNYDQRGDNATRNLQDDWFLAAHLAFNDIQNTEISASILSDRDHSSDILVMEFNRRLSDSWTMGLEWFSILDADEADIQLHQLSRDSFLEFRITYSF